MAYYNLTNWTNANNLLELLIATNNLSGGWFGILTLVSLHIILFIAFKTRGYYTKDCLTGSLYIATVLGLLLRTIELLPDFVLFIYIIGCALAFLQTTIGGD